MNVTKLILFSILLLFATSFASAQSTAQLEQKRKQLLKKIEQTNRLLQQNKKSTNSELAELGLLKEKTKAINEFIANLELEVQRFNQQIAFTEQQINEQEEDLLELKKSYSESIVTAYKRKNAFNSFVFILSSKSFNAAVQKFNYLKKLNAHRKRQASSIQETIDELEQQRQKVISLKQSKNELLKQQTLQKRELQNASSKIEATIHQLKAEGSTLLVTLKQQQAEEEQLKAEIQRIIAAELAKQREAERKRKEELAKNENSNRQPEDSTPNTYKSAPEIKKLSTKFESNKKSLPWPLTSGVIISSLGEYADALPGIKKDRDGIDIRTEINANVLSIFNGQVRSVSTIPGFNKVVIISHGSYYSVYGNLQTVVVSAGEEVTTQQKIGVLEEQNGTSVLHFQLWKNQSRLNPKLWLQPE